MPANPGNEFLVNSHTPLNQRTYAGGTSGTFFDSFGDGARSMRSIAMDANGNFVVAWSSVGQDNPAFDRQWGIYAQRFDKTGAPNGSSFLVNTIISFNQVAPSVAMNAAGDFAITWSSNAGSNQDDTNGYGVYTRFYSADGTAKTASETRVNTVTTANQFNSMIAMDADDDATSANDGGYVISWTSQNQDGDGNGVFAQRYDKNGAKAGSEITVNTLGGQITGAQQNSAIAMADDGSFVVVWESDQGSSQGDASGWGIFAQRFDALGNAQGSIISINQYTTGDQRLPSVAMKSDGSFVVAWTSVDQIAGGGQDIFYRRFDNQGNAIDSTDISANGISSTSPYGPDNTFVPGAQTDPIVSMSPNGDFLISWSSNDAAAPGVYVRRFSGSTGKPLSGGDGDLIHVNTALYGTASTPYSSVAASNNSFAAVWTVDSDGDQQGVVGRVYTIPDAANRAPTDLAITPAQVNENTATGTVVGTFGTTDPDSGNTFTYSFVTGTGDTDNGSFTIDNTTGQLKLNVVPDFETKSSYSIRVRTTDQGNLSFEKVLTIGIQNINEAPTDIALSANSVDENLPIGSVVGAFSTVDQDAGDSFTYSLVTGTGSTDNGLFTIDNTTGQLKLNVVPNFETKNSYSIRVRSRDQGGLTTEKVFAITVKNVNEAPSDITLSANNVDENQPIGTVVGTLSTADPDASSSFTYSLVTGTGSTDNSSFTIDPTTGQLKLNAIPDFETKSTYSIRVQSTDQGGLSTQKVFTINIKDVNETPTDVALSANRVDENVAIGTVVGTLSTTDPDAGDSFTYSLVTGTGSTDNSSFTIDSTTGQLKINVVPDFETQPTYSIRVKSADQAGLFTEKVLTIAVNNLNDAPQDISLSSTNVNENVPAGSLIGTFSTTDPDPSNTFTYSLTAGTGSTDNGLFTIDPATGQLKISASPNFETKNSYAIRVRSTDQDGKFFEKTFTVGVNDVNEIPTGLSLSPTNIQEGVAIGSIVGAFNTADPDTSDSFTYSLVSGTGSTDNSAFTIDPVTGQLKVNVVPDFETKPSYSIRVKTTDRGNNTFEKAFTITIDDQPDIPTDIGLSPSSVAENTAIGTVVGTLSSTDQDANDTFTYSLVTGTGSTDNSAFTIDPVTGELKLNVVPNYSNKSSYSIRVRTTDSTNLSYEKVLTVTVIDPNSTNRPPTDLSLSPTAINENSPTGSLIGTASTTDPNSGDSFTYSLVSGAGSTDNGLFTIDPTTGQLKANFVPDFETKSSYSIRVRTADQGNLTFEKSFTINVNNQPDAPTDISLSPSSVAENKAIGSVVGAFSSVDQDTGDTFTYSLVTGTGSTDNSAFTIDPTTGQLKLNVVPDFEGKPSYSIRVRTTDQTNRTFEKQFTVNITDQPEQPTDLSLSANTVNDGATVGSLVGTVTTADQDTGDSFTYSLVSGTGSTDNSAFTIDPATGQLKLNTTSDYSSQNSYSIRVKTTDSTNLSFEKVFTISVLDNSANRPPTNIGLSTNTVNETSPVGSLVGTFTTDDPNAGDSFTYSLVTGTGSTDNSAFTIDPTTGQLKLNVVPDFETKNSYAIRVRTTDQGNKFFEKAFTVNVNDLPEAPTNLTLTPNQVDENVTAGTIVGTLSSTDPDAAGSFTYSLVTGTGSTDNNAFTIDPTTGQLKINVVPNFEAKPTYSIRVQTKDSTGLIFEKALTVGIKNVNETPTNLSLSTTNVDEGVPSGTVVGGFATTDPDTGNTFTYSLVTGTGSTDNSAFTIDSTGQLKVNFVPDYNTKNSYAIRVRTTDQGGLFFEKQFTVNVVNLPDAPTDISLTPNQVDENVTTGTIVGTFGSVDPSGGTFTYSLVTGTGSTDNSAFTIDPTTGQLKINVVPNFEAKPSYSIRVQTKDDTGLTFEKALTVGIKDVNETPTDVSLISNSVNERVPVGTVVSGFSTTDPDTGNTFTYSLVTGTGSTDNSAFTIDPTTGQLKVNFVPDYNTKNSYAIRVRTTDQDGLFFEKALTVNINDVSDAPTDISLTPNQVNENVTAGTIVGTLSSTDLDGGSFTYSLVTGTGSTDNSAFTIDPVTGQLKINVVPNFEAKPTYSIRVQTKDSTGLIFEKALTVGIKNVNETPTDVSLVSNSVNERVPVGTVVSGFNTADPDTGNTFTYSLVTGTGSTDNSAFTIDPTTGQLKVNFVPDYNTKNSYAIRVRTTDQGGLFFEKALTVNINDVSDAPTDISLTPNEVNENVTAGTIVGTLSSTDLDGGSFTYSLVTGTGSTDNSAFTIDPVTGQLKINVVPNFEAKPTYSIRVQTKDSTGLIFEKALTVGIKDVNETPTDVSLISNSVNERVPVGTVVSGFSTTDPDTGNTFAYSLVTGAGSTDNSAFTIDPTTGQLKVNFVPDYNTKNSYAIRVRTTDQGGLFFEKQFTVNVVDLPDAPTDISLTPNQVDENVTAGTIVGTLSSTDPDAAGSFTYSLVTGTGSTDNSAFTIDPVTGQLKINVVPNFEAKPTYSIRVQTKDSTGLIFEKALTVGIKNVNETPTNLSLSTTNVDEGVPSGTVVGGFATTDPDTGNTFTYSLAAGTGSTDNSAFTIDPTTGQLKVNFVPDYNTKNSYAIRVRTTDQGGLFFEKQFTVNVVNLPDAPTDISLTPNQVNENVTTGTIVGTFGSVDPDGGSFLYSLVSGTGSTDNGLFTIDSAGQLKLNFVPDFETKNSYSIRVRTTDSTGLSIEKAFTIGIKDVNETPTDISLSPTSVNEASPIGTVVGTLGTTDPDSNDKFTYSLVAGTGNTDNSSFTIDPTTGQLKLNFVPDFETKNSYSIRVRTTDQGSLSFEKVFTVNITDKQETPTDLILAPSSINENVASGSLVGTLSTVDPDRGDVFTYSLVTGTGSNDNNLFTVDSQTGQLKVNFVPDFETKPTYSIRVRTTDSAGLFFEKALTVNIANLNEPPNSLTLSSTAIDEEVPANTLVGTISANDPEGGNLTYSLVQGFGDNAAFTINGNRLLINSSPDYEAKSAYSIQIAVTDAGGLSQIKNFAINVRNVNEAPTVSTTSGSVSYTENAAAITIDPTLNLSDPDSTNLTQATVSIQGYNNQQDQLSFTSPTGSGISGSFNATTGILTLQGTATLAAYQAALRSVVYKNLSDAPSATPRAIRFSVNDGSLTSNTAVRTVQIIPVNDVPVVTPSVSSLTVTAGERVTPLDPNLSVTDVDNTQLAGVTVTLNGYIAKEDTLLFSDQSGIVGSFNAINGVLTLSGNASVAAYQTALRSILYLNSSDRPTTTPRLITISANDGSSSSDPNAAQIPIQFKEVTAVPVIDLNGGGAGNDFSNTFVIAGPAVAVTSTEARLTDTGSSVLTAAQVKISNLFDPQNEELQVDPSGTGISTSYDRTTGTLTLTGAAPLSSYLNVLRSIKYQNHAANPDRTTRVILFSVSDGTGRSEPAQTTIQMTDMKLNDGTDGNDQMITTPAIDRIHALGGDDKVTSILANLQQNDVIDGGGGKDTFVLTDGTGSALIDITNPVNQISGIFTNNTTIANFENFDFAGFQGNVTLIGSNDSNTVISGAGGDNLSGGAGDDRLVSNAGSDRLDGGLGNDVLEGGLGDDLYIVDSPNDQVIEGLNAGFDIISASTSYTLPNHVEELDLTGFAVVGTGNALDNTIVGNDANNLLNGNLGADLLIGNAGNDSLWGDNGDDELIGGTGNDTLVGGDGNDRLDGGQGRDRLTGGTGKDTFVLSSSQKQSRDVITDFNSKDDTIVISRSSFSSRLKRGKVRANAFALGNHAFDTKDRFIYNSKTGSLFFDIDGIGGAKQVQIAQVSRNATLNRSDIVVMP